MALVIAGLSVLGCANREEPTWPKFPLCFVEAGSWETSFERKLGHSEPIACKEALFMPYYSRYNRAISKYERAVSKPFLYRPGTPLIIPPYKPGFEFRGVVALCPGWLGKGVNSEFYGVDTISGKRCQLVPVVKARDVKEANRVLFDFKYLLSQKEVTLGTTRNPLTVGADEKYVFALSTDFRTPSNGEYCSHGPNVFFFVWEFEHGTKLSVDLTGEEAETVNAFFERNLRSEAKKGMARERRRN
jgi:hypothetical protein